MKLDWYLRGRYSYFLFSDSTVLAYQQRSWPKDLSDRASLYSVHTGYQYTLNAPPNSLLNKIRSTGHREHE
jgi:hypothetical protein